MQIFVGLVVWVVAPVVTDEIADIAEILADHEDLGCLVTEPLPPMTGDFGIELEFGAAPDPPGVAIDANPASLPRRDQRAIFLHTAPSLHSRPFKQIVIPTKTGIHRSAPESVA